MNILFLTICRINDISEKAIYTDLMRKFRDEGHKVFIAAPVERCFKQPTTLKQEDGVHLLKIRTLNLEKTNILEKGIGTLLLEHQFLSAIKKYFSDIRFDLVLYSTPPITFTKVIKAIKKHNTAKTYLLLKDIFPQNAVDLGLIRKNTLLHRYFRAKECDMYAISDHIGCMSPANVEYVCKHNPTLDPRYVEVNPNSVGLPVNAALTKDERNKVRRQYGIPIDKTVFIYGGNLGKPQGIEFLIEALSVNSNNKNAFFVIVGSGTEYPRIRKWFQLNEPANSILLPGLSRPEYEKLVQASDVGMIFLDSRFTIPNYPSRLLSYLEHKLPVLAATDINTDIGKEAEKNGYGVWCKSGDLKSFNEKIESLSNNQELVRSMGIAGYDYLLANFTVERSFSTIMQHFK